MPTRLWKDAAGSSDRYTHMSHEGLADQPPDFKLLTILSEEGKEDLPDPQKSSVLSPS